MRRPRWRRVKPPTTLRVTWGQNVRTVTIEEGVPVSIDIPWRHDSELGTFAVTVRVKVEYP